MGGIIGLQALVAARVRDLEHHDFSTDQLAAEDASNYAHAPGRICPKCGRPIEADQPARKRGESSWAHDVCPE